VSLARFARPSTRPPGALSLRDPLPRLCSSHASGRRRAPAPAETAPGLGPPFSARDSDSIPRSFFVIFFARSAPLRKFWFFLCTSRPFLSFLFRAKRAFKKIFGSSYFPSFPSFFARSAPLRKFWLQITSKSHPNHIQNTSKSHPNHIQITSKSRPNHIQITSILRNRAPKHPLPLMKARFFL
jgi:hypothetical protein